MWISSTTTTRITTISITHRTGVTPSVRRKYDDMWRYKDKAIISHDSLDCNPAWFSIKCKINFIEEKKAIYKGKLYFTFFCVFTVCVCILLSCKKAAMTFKFSIQGISKEEGKEGRGMRGFRINDFEV